MERSCEKPEGDFFFVHFIAALLLLYPLLWDCYSVEKKAKVCPAAKN